MKKLLYIFYSCFALSSFSQECVFSLLEDTHHQHRPLTDEIPDSIIYFRISPYIVKNSGGEMPISEEKVIQRLGRLNHFFAEGNIQFRINPITIFASDSLYDYQVPKVQSDFSYEETIIKGNYDSTAINIYFCNELSIGTVTVKGVGRAPEENHTTRGIINAVNRIFIGNETVDFKAEENLAHEVGHYFGLLHTFDTANGVEKTDGTNCSSAGDLICDTHANPDPSIVTSIYNQSTKECSHNGAQLTDEYGNYSLAPINNLMTYSGWSCGRVFTEGQFKRMWRFVDKRLEYKEIYSPVAKPRELDKVVVNGNFNIDDVSIDLSWNDAGAPGYLVYKIMNGAAELMLSTTSLSFKDKDIVTSKEYSYKIVRLDDIDGDSEQIEIESGVFYCSASFYKVCGTFPQIYNVKVNDKRLSLNDDRCDTISGGNTVYENHNISLNLNSKNSFRIDIKKLGATGYQPQHVAFWIDYNQNGDFEASESAYQSQLADTNAQGYTPSFFSGDFTIPSNAKEGSTKLRVRSNTQNAGIVTSPCAYSDYGEVEDYFVEIKNLETGINDLKESFSINISNNQVSIVSDLNIEVIQILDFSGRILKTAYSTSTIALPSQNLVYIIRFYDGVNWYSKKISN